MRNLMQRLIAAVLVGLLGSGSAVADASDWLPLAVGNSWTYSHDYYGGDKSPWPNFRDPLGFIPRFTLSVLRTEVIDGHTYFVLSDMPESWPPVPPQFIAGKKLRWVGDHLMERTADGEQALFRFDGDSQASGAVGTIVKTDYAVAAQGKTIQVTTQEIRDHVSHDYTFSFSGEAGPARSSHYALSEYFSASGYELTRDLLGANVTFLKGFGVRVCGVSLYDYDVPLFKNVQEAHHAVIDGRSVTVWEAREEAATRLKSSDATHIEWLSWGAIKQEGSP